MIGPLELIVIAILILLIVGRNRLPEAGRSLGGGIRNFIDGIRNADDEDEDEDEAPEAITARSESDRKPPAA